MSVAPDAVLDIVSTKNTVHSIAIANENVPFAVVESSVLIPASGAPCGPSAIAPSQFIMDPSTTAVAQSPTPAVLSENVLQSMSQSLSQSLAQGAQDPCMSTSTSHAPLSTQPQSSSSSNTSSRSHSHSCVVVRSARRDLVPNLTAEPFGGHDFACILTLIKSEMRSNRFEEPANACLESLAIAAWFLHAILASALALVVALPVLVLSAVYALPFVLGFAVVGAGAVATCPAYGWRLRLLGAIAVFSTLLLGSAVSFVAAVVASPFLALYCGFTCVDGYGYLSYKPMLGMRAPGLALEGWVDAAAPLTCCKNAWDFWRAPLSPDEVVRDIQVFVWLESCLFVMLGGILGILPCVGIALLYCIPIWIRIIILSLQLPKIDCAFILVWPFAIVLAVVLTSPPILLGISVVVGFLGGAVCMGLDRSDTKSRWAALWEGIVMCHGAAQEFAKGSWNL